MKTTKILYLFLYVTLAFLLLTACVQNPQNTIVTSKNDGSFDEQIIESNDENHNPDDTQSVVYEDSFYSTDGSVLFRVSLNEIATAANLPVVQVTPHFLSEDDAQRVAQILFPDTIFYEADPVFAPQYSKKQIEEKIQRWSYYTNNDALKELLGEFPDNTIEIIKKFIEEFTSMYETTPEEDPHNLCLWKFKKASLYQYTEEEIYNSGRDISTDNDNIMAQFQSNGAEYCYSVSTRNQEDFKLNNISAYLFSGISPTGIDEKIYRAQLCRTEYPTDVQITDVKEKANQMMQQMDLGEWQIDQCYVKTTYYGNTPEYIICITAIPVIHGIPAIRTPQLENLKSENTYASNYYHSDISFQFSANGDLILFRMYSPIDVSEVINENVKVLSMEQLMEKAKTHLLHSDYFAYGFEPQTELLDEDLSCTVSICELNYGMARVKVPNTDESYYFVPAFVLYGNAEYSGNETGNVYFSTDTPITLVVINAIDGSIINTTNE